MVNFSAHIETLRDERELAGLKNAWDALCDDLQDSISAFASFAWYETWWQHFSAGATLNILVMWEADRLVGIAPLMLRRTTVHGLPVTAVCFIENRQSLHNDFLILPAFRETFIREMLHSLLQEASRWDVMVFRNLPDNSENRKILISTLAETGKTWQQSSTWYNSPFLVPNGGWTEYLAGRSIRTRKSLRNIQNNMHKAGEVSVRHIRTWEEFLAVRDDVFHVAKQSWAEKGGDSLASPANEEFFNDLARRAAEKGWLSLWALELNRKMIAIEFHLRAFGKEHALRGHYLPDFAPLSPGTYLEMQILEHIFEETQKVHIYDFCGSFESYKKKWTDSCVPHWDVATFGDRIYGRCVAFHETITVPFLKRVFPDNFWDSRLVRLCGISTNRMGT